MGSQRVRDNWVTFTFTFPYTRASYFISSGQWVSLRRVWLTTRGYEGRVTWLLDSGPWIWHWPRDKGSLGSSRGQRPPSSESGRGMKTLRTRWERGDLAPVSCEGLQAKQTPNPAHRTLERIWTESTQLIERRRLSRGPSSWFSSTSNSAHIKCETPEGMPGGVEPIGFRNPSRQGEEQWHVRFSLAFILTNSPQENF